MDVFKAVQLRRSVRSYKPDRVPDRVLRKLLKAARLAPSAHNAQPWRFIVVTSKEKLERIARGGRWAGFVSDAPMVIVGCGDTRSRHYVHDTCIALQNLVLTATEEGLGTCWIGSFTEQDLRQMLKLPESLRVVALISIGYPNEAQSGASPRKPLSEIAFKEEYCKPLA